MEWEFKSPAGVFSIRPDQDDRYVLFLESESLESYYSAGDAAVDVACQTTGFSAWDELDDVDAPDDIDDWIWHV